MIRKLQTPARVRFVTDPVTGEDGGGAPDPAPVEDQQPGADDPAPTEDEQSAPDEGADSVDALPAWAQAEINRLRSENAQRRTKAKELEEKLTGALSADEAAELRSAHEKLERELLRERVAHKHKLPAELAERLQGATEEELVADAKKLQRFAAAPAPSDPKGGLNPTEDADAFDPVAAAQKVRSRRY